MTRLYARWMDRWERKLATRDTNRVVRAFDWGADWLHSVGFPAFPASLNGDSAACMSRFVDQVLADSDRFFSYEPVRDFRLAGSLTGNAAARELTFTSPVLTRYPENNTARAL